MYYRTAIRLLLKFPEGTLSTKRNATSSVSNSAVTTSAKTIGTQVAPGLRRKSSFAFHFNPAADYMNQVISMNSYHPLQSTPPSSKYHTILFKVPHRPLQSTTPPSSKYHTTLFKVPGNI